MLVICTANYEHCIPWNIVFGNASSSEFFEMVLLDYFMVLYCEDGIFRMLSNSMLRCIIWRYLEKSIHQLLVSQVIVY